jgi:uncharacterized OB-fold protein
MSQQAPFTIEQFYKHTSQGKLMGGKCKRCGAVYLPPRPVCSKCFSKEFEWVEIPPKGKLLTYTIIHVAPIQFQSMSPYTVGIIQLDYGLKIPGIIRDVAADEIEMGMRLKVVFNSSVESLQWPQWPRYHLKPA